MKKCRVALFVFVFVLFFALYSFCRNQVTSYRHNVVMAYAPPSARLPAEVVKILAGEYKGLVSEWLLLEIGSFLGSKQNVTPEQWKNIAAAFEYCLELDPYFQQSYIYVQGHLPWAGKMPRVANTLLEVSRTSRTWDFRPGYLKGFNDYYFLADFKSASREFLRASKVKDSPVLLSVLGARFAVKSDQKEAAITLLTTQYELAENEKNRSELADRITALKGIIVIEAAIDSFKLMFLANPDSLNSLVEYGFLPQLPVNPYGPVYHYDPVVGSVDFDLVGKDNKPQ